MTSGEGEPPSAVRTLTHTAAIVQPVQLTCTPTSHCVTLQIRSPSQMSPSHLQAEVRRCTREDGTIGLVSVCHPCHQQAERRYRLSTSTKPSSRPPLVRRTVARNRSLDIAAKMERAECQCDQRCHRRVTADNVGMFEWDHLVQSFDDADYHSVSTIDPHWLLHCQVGEGDSQAQTFACHMPPSTLKRAAAPTDADESGEEEEDAK